MVPTADKDEAIEQQQYGPSNAKIIVYSVLAIIAFFVFWEIGTYSEEKNQERIRSLEEEIIGQVREDTVEELSVKVVEGRFTEDVGNYSYFSWKVEVTNPTDLSCKFNLIVRLLDKQELELEKDIEPDCYASPKATSEITGRILVSNNLTNQVETVRATLDKAF